MTSEAAEVIRELVEALEGLTPVGRAKHPAIAVGQAWLRQQQVPAHTQYPTHLPGWVNLKDCNQCGQKFFFARSLPKGSESPRWMAFVPVCVETDQQLLDAVKIKFDAGNVPTVVGEGTGVQWFVHRVLCGQETRPKSELLGPLWDATAGKYIIEEAEAIGSLLSILDETA